MFKEDHALPLLAERYNSVPRAATILVPSEETTAALKLPLPPTVAAAIAALVTPPSVDTTSDEPEVATTTAPSAEADKLFQLALAADSLVQSDFSPPGFTVVGITKLGASFTLAMVRVTVATPELSNPSFTLKVKLSVPIVLAAGVYRKAGAVPLKVPLVGCVRTA